jgi:F-type H+-transporting ATPase subunit delta
MIWLNNMKSSEKTFARALVEQLGALEAKDLADVATALVSELARRKETYRVRSVIRALDQAWAEAYGAGTIKITTAYPLNESIKKKLEAVAKGAELKEEVDPSVIGGATLRIDERIIDGSIKGHLKSLTHAFTTR